MLSFIVKKRMQESTAFLPSERNVWQLNLFLLLHKCFRSHFFPVPQGSLHFWGWRGTTYKFLLYLDRIAFFLRYSAKKHREAFPWDVNGVKHMNRCLGLQWAHAVLSARSCVTEELSCSLLNPLCGCDKERLLKQSKGTHFIHAKDFTL